MYLCPPDADDAWSGVAAIRKGRSNSLYPFELTPGISAKLHAAEPMPVESTGPLILDWIFKGRARTVPFPEGLAFLRSAAERKQLGTREQWSKLSPALTAAPELR